MAKIAMIGAGSLVFCKTLMSDFLATPALDPLTAAVLTLDEIRRMTSEMLTAEAKHLPQFTGRSLRPVPAISIPKNLERQEVPVDPALAIANRFGKLAQA